MPGDIELEDSWWGDTAVEEESKLKTNFSNFVEN